MSRGAVGSLLELAPCSRTVHSGGKDVFSNHLCPACADLQSGVGFEKRAVPATISLLHQMVHPGSLVVSQGWGLIDLPLRASHRKDKAKVEVEGTAKLKPQVEAEKTPDRIARCST